MFGKQRRSYNEGQNRKNIINSRINYMYFWNSWNNMDYYPDVQDVPRGRRLI